MSLKRSGLNPLAYMGVEPSQPSQFVALFRDPTPNDINFNIGTRWLNRATESPWELVNLNAGIATWIQLGSSSGAVVELMGNSGTASGPIVTVTTGTGNAQGTALFTGNNAHTLTQTFSDANNNTGLGALSLSSGSLSGTANTALGWESGQKLTTGGFNTFVGGQTGLQTVSGHNNTVIGYNSGSAYTSSESNNILLNSVGTVSESNVLRIGNSTGSGSEQLSNAYISGIQGVNVGSVASVVSISGDHLGTTTLTAGTGVTITPGANTIVIAATGGGGGGSGASIIGVSGINQTLSTVGATSWISPFGEANETTQSLTEFVVPTAGTISNLYVNITANTDTTNGTVTLNKNGVNTALVATITASTVAVFSDLVHSVPVVQGDTIQFEMSASTAGIFDGIISADFTSSGGSGDAATSFITSPATGTAVPATGVITVAGTGGTVVTAGGSTITINSPVGGTGHPLITTYSTPGTFTWNRQAGTTFVATYGCSGGAGGGSGGRAPSQKSGGGTGGGGGPSFFTEYPASFIGSSATVVVGSGGVGGSAVTTDNTAGHNGVLGGVSSFGVIFVTGAVPSPGQGGPITPGPGTIQGGSSGGNSSAGGGISLTTVPPSGSYSNMSSSGFNLPAFTPPGATGGGGGIGASSSSPIPAQAANGGNITANGSTSSFIFLAGGIGGIESGTINGTNGSAAPTGGTANGLFTFGTGGGGGGGQSSGPVAGNGGNGGFPGGGGGGGGGSLNGTNSGAGGNGADGIVYVIEW